MDWKPLRGYHKVLFLLSLLFLSTVLMTGCSEEEPQGTPIDISYLNKNGIRVYGS